MADIFELFKKIGHDQPVEKPISHLIVGLGNPGEKYAHTRHNAGFLALDYISQKANVELKRLKFQSYVAEADMGGHRVLLMKPQTYMNQSGQAVRAAVDFYRIPPENIIVISDDINLAPGCMRIRSKGSDGGQKGMQNIIYLLESDRFPRIRIGVGEKPNPEMALADWVLSTMNRETLETIWPCLEASYDASVLIMDGKIEEAMSRYNGMKPSRGNHE